MVSLTNNRQDNTRGTNGDRFHESLAQPQIWESNRPCQILSLDGGGIKGLYSAALLAHVEEDLGCRIVDHFDLITGTSTGAIIAAALGLGLRPRDVVEFYIKHGPSIFPASPAAASRASLRHYFRRKFDNEALERALRSCLGESLLGESKSRLVIPSYDMGRDDVCIFKTPHHPRLARDHKFKAWQVVMASAAAPTYFPAVRSIESRRLVDGGMWANNPAMVGVTEVIGLLGVPPMAISVLSLGTTDPVCNTDSNLDHGGLWAWKKEAVRVAMRGQSLSATNQARLLLGKDSVIRIDPVVADGVFHLDKLNVDGHLALAAHDSRTAMPEIARFTRHRASPYLPFYGPLANAKMEVLS